MMRLRTRFERRFPTCVNRLEGAYALHLARIFMIVASIDLLAVGGLSLIIGETSSGTQLVPYDLLVLALAAFPILGSVAATIAVWQGKKERSTQLSIEGKVPATFWDRIWKLTGYLTFLIYSVILLLGAFGGKNPISLSLINNFPPELTISFSMVVAVLTMVLLAEKARFVYMVALYPLSVLFLISGESWTFREALVGPTSQLGFNLLLLCALTWLTRRADSLDVATGDLEEQELATEGQKATEIARRRADSYIHDNLLSVLSVAGKGGVDASFLRRAATRALVSIETSTGVTGSQTVSEVFSQIQSDVGLWPEDITVAIEEEPGCLEKKIPGQVAVAIRDASREAIWNSIQHARTEDESPVFREIMLRASGDGVHIRVRDHGVAALQESERGPRHGVSTSIIQRMVDVGGYATADFYSREGGYEVEIDWRFLKKRRRHPEPPFRMGDEEVAPVAQTRAAQNLALFLVLTQVVVLVCEQPAYWNMFAPFLAWVWQGAAAFLLVRPWTEVRLPIWVRTFVFIAIGLSNFLALSAIIPGGYPGYAAWSLGTGWMLCIGLLVRVGPSLAWGALTFLSLTTWLWTLVTAQPAALAGSMIAGQAVALTFYTGVVWWCKVTMDSLARARRETWDMELMRLHHQKTTEAIMERLRGVEDNVRPILERLAADGKVDSRLSKTAAILEAELRDEIRAPILCVPDLVAAIREARQRGVEVVLLDDRGGVGLTEEELQPVIASGIEILRGTAEGRVVIRLQPAGRQLTATVSGPNGLFTISPNGVQVYLSAGTA